METALYLDTARIGKMTASAKHACHEAMGIAGMNPYRLIKDFVEGDMPSTIKMNGVPLWTGLTGLKQKILTTSQASRDNQLIAASSSTSLLKLAARTMFLACRRVLTTDLMWPRYQRIMTGEAKRTDGEMHQVNVRRSIFDYQLSEDEIVNRIVGDFIDCSCDGLFLTAVSSDGIRLPIEKIIDAAQLTGRLRFVVIDGAQEFSHCPTELGRCNFDLYLFGSHKWLGSHLPMSFGIYGNSRSRHFVETTLERMLRLFLIEDPLLNYLFQLQSKSQADTKETINLLPLFAASGALSDQTNASHTHEMQFASRIRNSESMSEITSQTNWEIISSVPELRTAIVMLRNPRLAETTSGALERRFRQDGVILSGYDGGKIRLSMPEQAINQCQSDRLRYAFETTNSMAAF